MINSDMTGRVWLFGDNVDTDHIIPARFMLTADFEEMSTHAFEDVCPEFGKARRDGNIVVSGKNFGCGSSRQAAPLVIQMRGVSCIVAESFARIFLRNAVNMGFPVIELPDAARLISNQDEISVRLGEGRIINLTKNEEYRIQRLPPFMMSIYDAGGLESYIIKRMVEER